MPSMENIAEMYWASMSPMERQEKVPGFSSVLAYGAQWYELSRAERQAVVDLLTATASKK